MHKSFKAMIASWSPLARWYWQQYEIAVSDGNANTAFVKE
jgi:hypothetical protein